MLWANRKEFKSSAKRHRLPGIGNRVRLCPFGRLGRLSEFANPPIRIHRRAIGRAASARSGRAGLIVLRPPSSVLRTRTSTAMHAGILVHLHGSLFAFPLRKLELACQERNRSTWKPRITFLLAFSLDCQSGSRLVSGCLPSRSRPITQVPGRRRTQVDLDVSSGTGRTFTLTRSANQRLFHIRIGLPPQPRIRQGPQVSRSHEWQTHPY
jgi:hypothetical protein